MSEPEICKRYPFNLFALMTRGVIWTQRKAFAKLRPEASINPLKPTLDADGANRRIRELLSAPEPCFIGRFGGIELDAIMRGVYIRDSASKFKKALRLFCGEGGPFWWDNSILRNIELNAGFFPSTPENLLRFSDLMVEAAKEVDLLGSYSWANGERILTRGIRQPPEVCTLGQLSRFLSPDFWSPCLAGKKVLVIHPFADTIKAQYARREKLWPRPEILPEFDLKVVRAVSSLAGFKPPQFDTWFDALEAMEREIAAVDFDIAIIGCGAYGFPLGAFIKRELGRKAIHLGGITQIFFGIRGKRWDDQPGSLASVYNEYWVHPFDSDKPPCDLSTVERGCYW